MIPDKRISFFRSKTVTKLIWLNTYVSPLKYGNKLATFKNVLLCYKAILLLELGLMAFLSFIPVSYYYHPMLMPQLEMSMRKEPGQWKEGRAGMGTWFT